MATPIVEWTFKSPEEDVLMTFNSPEEFYTERRRFMVEINKKPESPAVIVPKVVANVRV